MKLLKEEADEFRRNYEDMSIKFEELLYSYQNKEN